MIRRSIAACLLCLVAPAALGAQTPLREGGEGSMPLWVRWGWQSSDLLRYNRVEGVSVGVRARVYPDTPWGRVTVGATGRLGMADHAPDLRLDVARETLSHRIALDAFRELAAAEDELRPLGLANSLTALVLGRDDGDYYRRTGVALAWTPPSARRRAHLVRGWAERHDRVDAKARFALAHATEDAWRFRPNLAADEGWDVGAELRLSPWWGTDPLEPQAGVSAAFRVGAGTWGYRGLELGARTLLPLPARFRVDLAAGAGATWGSPPAQRLHAVGGPATLRGFDPRALAGPDVLRGRAELSRTWPLGALAAFGDAAWAGDSQDFAFSRMLASAGLGVAMADGRLRADAAWAVYGPRGFRLELWIVPRP